MRDPHQIDAAERKELKSLASALSVDPSVDRDPISHYWTDISAGIILAGGAYPFVILLIFALFYAVAIVWGFLTGVPAILEPVVWPALLFGAIAYGLLAGVLGMIWAAIVSLFTAPFVYLFVQSLQLRGNIVWFGAVWGGLVGFLAASPVPMTLIANPGWQFNSPLQVLILLVAGPGLTTILGQFGGAWGGAGAMRKFRRTLAANSLTDSLSEFEEVAFDGGNSSDSKGPISGIVERQPFQFGIRHLLWITFWLSLLLSAIRLSGVPFRYVIPLLAGWLAYQIATLYVGSHIVRKFARWHARPQTELAGRIL